MQTLSIVGPAADRLAERLAPRLDGRVATVERLPERTDGTDADGVDGSFGLGDDGAWVGAGEHRSLGDLLDALAVEYDYALLSGVPEARAPTVVVGDEGIEVRGDVVDTVDAVDDADLDALARHADDGEPYITLETLVEQVKQSPRAERAGAIATFTGRVRAKDGGDDSRTTHLAFEKYEGVAEDRMTTISEELTARDGVEEVAMHHRTGVIEDGEDIVFVVVLAGHRTESFRAVEDGINRLKDEVPIFKKETTVDEEFWVHDRQ
ncbi:molybdopterin synthase catalytic subunit [Halogranum amylolyticum]|uniref:Molybdopterin synthase catalytic subunit n=1 Tax=Halogranum amylolyticum TaxID=660520 RepID=A0A1H8WT78_9EURY|nr:molybdopterin synthase [Halogranum amylolyticum]SEP30841.1 molybdopterin synthase catalytic subunit [Halogranum amylolyticum]